jgi:hypothetical protein
MEEKEIVNSGPTHQIKARLFSAAKGRNKTQK